MITFLTFKVLNPSVLLFVILRRTKNAENCVQNPTVRRLVGLFVLKNANFVLVVADLVYLR